MWGYINLDQSSKQFSYVCCCVFYVCVIFTVIWCFYSNFFTVSNVAVIRYKRRCYKGCWDVLQSGMVEWSIPQRRWDPHWVAGKGQGYFVCVCVCAFLFFAWHCIPTSKPQGQVHLQTQVSQSHLLKWACGLLCYHWVEHFPPRFSCFVLHPLVFVLPFLFSVLNDVWEKKDMFSVSCVCKMISVLLCEFFM